MKKSGLIIIAALSVVASVLLILTLIQQRKIADLQQKVEQLSEPAVGVYRKLARGQEVSILIVGDSIGASAGASPGHSWERLLTDWIYEEYAVRANVTNVSLGGTGSYAGYVQVMNLDDGVDYDLAIVCYGHNDSPEYLSESYEAIIRALRAKYIYCDLICVLQSSQRTYTDIINKIRELSDHYGIPQADTIAAFENSGHAYEELSTDGIHPNDLGYSLYFEEISRLIREGTDAFREYIREDIAPLNPDMDEYERYYYVPYDQAVRSADGLSSQITFYAPLSGKPGLDYDRSGEGEVKIYIDDVPLCDEELGWDDFGTAHFISTLGHEPVSIEHSVRLEFTNAESSSKIHGLVFTDVK